MDWTGGTRRRFAGAKNNNTTLQRQKAHFAKARAAVRHEPVTGYHRTSTTDHNDDTRARSYKGQSPALLEARNKSSTDIGHARRTGGPVDTQLNMDKELLLIASRRKLLARSDWLALDATRPLRIDFPVASDRDRVGQRKKIKKSSAARTKAVHRRALTPVFEDRRDHTKYLMSGALPLEQDNQIEVKIGTSAFSSRNGLSQKSNTPRNVSMGPQSTALSHLSEESMLLGDGGDTFDADQVDVPAYIQERHPIEESNVGEWTPNFDSACQLDVRGLYVSQEGDTGRMVTDGPELQQPGTWAPHQDLRLTAASPNCNGQATNARLNDHPASFPNSTDHANDIQQAYGVENEDNSMPTDPDPVAVPVHQHVLDLETEEAWKQLMGIPTQSASFTSRKALVSSSDHMTASQSTQRAAPMLVRHETFEDDETFAHIELDQHPTTLDLPLTTTEGQLTTHNRTATRSSGHTNENADNEALWREFIIGSEHSESEDEFHAAWQRSRGKRRSSSEPQSLQLSGLGTSDRATRAETVPDSPTLFAAASKIVDASLEQDEDSIEDVPFEPTIPDSPHNIHITPARSLDPRRFITTEKDNEATRVEETGKHAIKHRYSLRRTGAAHT